MGDLSEQIESALALMAQAMDVFGDIDLKTMSALKNCLGDPVSGSILRQRLIEIDAPRQDLFEMLGMDQPERGENTAHDRPPSVVEPSPTSHTPPQTAAEHPANGRRSHSKAFDFLVYFGIDVGRRDLPVSQQDLFRLMAAFDERTKSGPLTTKLNRLKQAGYLSWRSSTDLSVTDEGKSKMTDLRRYLDESDRARMRNAFKTAWQIDVEGL